MVANDGPHYGDNVKMMGPGKYKLILTIAPPDANTHAHFAAMSTRKRRRAVVQDFCRRICVHLCGNWKKRCLLNGAMEVGGLRNFAAIFLATLLLACGAAIARSEEEPVFTIEFKDGAVSPQRLESQRTGGSSCNW